MKRQPVCDVFLEDNSAIFYKPFSTFIPDQLWNIAGEKCPRSRHSIFKSKQLYFLFCSEARGQLPSDLRDEYIRMHVSSRTWQIIARRKISIFSKWLFSFDNKQERKMERQVSFSFYNVHCTLLGGESGRVTVVSNPVQHSWRAIIYLSSPLLIFTNKNYTLASLSSTSLSFSLSLSLSLFTTSS